MYRVRCVVAASVLHVLACGGESQRQECGHVDCSCVCTDGTPHAAPGTIWCDESDSEARQRCERGCLASCPTPDIPDADAVATDLLRDDFADVPFVDPGPDTNICGHTDCSCACPDGSYPEFPGTIWCDLGAVESERLCKLDCLKLCPSTDTPEIHDVDVTPEDASPVDTGYEFVEPTCSGAPAFAIFRLTYPDLLLKYQYVGAAQGTPVSAESALQLAVANADPWGTPPRSPQIHQFSAGSLEVVCREPSDFGWMGVVDRRNGVMVLSVEEVWAGHGSWMGPTNGTRFADVEWVTREAPAPEETFSAICAWEVGVVPLPPTDAWKQILRTRVANEIGSCGRYQAIVVGWAPGVGLMNPSIAEVLVILIGTGPSTFSSCEVGCPVPALCDSGSCKVPSTSGSGS